MKKLLLLFSFLILINTSLQAQNLVPNPSFEDTIGVGCPDGIFQSTLPTGWSSYSITPDYFNSCSPSIYYNSVPRNYWGYQSAASGNAYCGAWSYQTLQTNTREYIGRKLSESLIVGQKYFASLKVNLAEISNCGINKIGILFSNTLFSNLNPAPIMNYAHIFSNNIITDTLNWTSISGSFIADSTYQYIIIGNFFEDIQIDTIILGPPKPYGFGGYYYFDDIYVGTDSLASVNNFQNYQSTVVLFPNPASNEITVDIKESYKKSNILIYNLFGGKINEYVIQPSTCKIDVSNLYKGIYFIQFNFNNKTIIQKLIIN